MERAINYLPPSAGLPEDDLDATVLAFEEAARRLDLEPEIVARLRHPEREIIVHLPHAHTYTGIRVQHSRVRGPALGRLYLRPGIHLAEIRTRAMESTWQCALLDLPLGGAAGAIVCDPDRLPERELKGLVHDYAAALRGLLGPLEDVVAPGGGCNETVMAWISGGLLPGTAVGLPAALGGRFSFPRMAGQGLAVLAQEALAERGIALPGARVAIEGFAGVGAAAAERLAEAGARMVALSDVSGGLFQEHGLDLSSVQAYAASHGLLFGYPEAAAVRNAEVLEAPCDLLITAAAEKQIVGNNAGRIRAGVVLEAAWGAVTRPAGELLEARGVLLIPDLLATAGETVAAFLEWTRQVHAAPLTDELAAEVLRRRLREACAAVRAVARKHSLSLRQAAHQLAVDRVATALRFMAR
jgi:glutamate dehydrogenase/leucine dehydrogenase